MQRAYDVLNDINISLHAQANRTRVAQEIR